MAKRFVVVGLGIFGQGIAEALYEEGHDVVAVDDAGIRDEIRTAWREFGFAICPHSATATRAWRELPPDRRAGHHWILVATAHPAKFETIVEPLIGARVPVPPELAAILSRPSRSVRMSPATCSHPGLSSRLTASSTPPTTPGSAAARIAITR